MGKGTPCPMPPQNKQAIRDAISAFRAAGVHQDEIARSLQKLWPGCTGNHVRGVFAGLESAKLGGNSGDYKERAARVQRAKQPWTPGQPKPERTQ